MPSSDLVAPGHLRTPPHHLHELLEVNHAVAVAINLLKQLHDRVVAEGVFDLQRTCSVGSTRGPFEDLQTRLPSLSSFSTCFNSSWEILPSPFLHL